MLRNVVQASGCLSVVHGEVDSLHSSNWRYGYFHDTTYTIFSETSRVCHVALIDGVAAIGQSHTPILFLSCSFDHSSDRVFTIVSLNWLNLELYPDGSSSRRVPISQIKNVCVSVSPAPFVTRKLFFKCLDGSEVVILTDEVPHCGDCYIGGVRVWYAVWDISVGFRSCWWDRHNCVIRSRIRNRTW